LRKAGLVSERRSGRFAYYRAKPEGLGPLVRWVHRYRAFWPDRIKKLEDVLNGMNG
jgi:DNA-binding transcriptional ArsR family regulator